MACCVDKAREEADACCASGEAQQNADPLATGVPSALPVPQPIAFVMASAVPAVTRAPVDLASYAPLTSDSERHVVLSIFLI